MNQTVPSSHSSPVTGQAIVIGSGMAGLLAARVLSDHFARVIVLDRDELSSKPLPRKGVPQGRHPHALLLRGQQELEEFFPGISEELITAGALPTNLGSGFHHTMYGQTRICYDSAFSVLSCSRPLLESTVYRRVYDLPNIEFLSEIQVVGLLNKGAHVAGVQVRAPDTQASDIPQTLAADLVVDTSGRGSQAPKWLAALDLPVPEEQVISASLSYTSRIYKRPADLPPSLNLISVQPHLPYSRRGAVITALEGGRLHLSQFGMLSDHAPSDEAGYLEFARSLCDPIIYELIARAEPLSPILSFRGIENRWRRYDLLSQHLEGFLVMGDAAMTLNPIYGQGITVAAISASILNELLREQCAKGQALVGLAGQFQARQTEITRGAWQLASSEDQQWVDFSENRPQDPRGVLMQRYMDQVMKTSLVVPEIAEVFFQVGQMMAPPSEFFRPDVVLQVFGQLQ